VFAGIFTPKKTITHGLTWINMDKHGGYSHDFPIFPTMSWASNKKKVTEAFTRIPCGAAGWSMNQSRLGGHGLEDHLKKTSTINIQQHQSTILYIGAYDSIKYE